MTLNFFYLINFLLIELEKFSAKICRKKCFILNFAITCDLYLQIRYTIFWTSRWLFFKEPKLHHLPLKSSNNCCSLFPRHSSQTRLSTYPPRWSHCVFPSNNAEQMKTPTTKCVASAVNFKDSHLIKRGVRGR